MAMVSQDVDASCDYHRVPVTQFNLAHWNVGCNCNESYLQECCIGTYNIEICGLIKDMAPHAGIFVDSLYLEIQLGFSANTFIFLSFGCGVGLWLLFQFLLVFLLVPERGYWCIGDDLLALLDM